MPNEMYSIAQIQGYLLTKKRDPLGAAQGVGDWLAAQWRVEVVRWRRGIDEPYLWVDVWEQVVSEAPEEAPVEGREPARGASLESGADTPTNILDVLAGEPRTTQ
ncbi:hypothetical protein DFH07DRAFT_781239 [Mycena maculata]|uniref:Mitochondrial chaperone BCS1-like ATPase lid domain-containing protein n=1 Tax=Mycena maculata TaxID=230809 RepID=A0AAD7HZE5_9AGAR|nr:hypothetical protein DFH07DRAFT_781239 [Mycena maculata]